MILFSSNIESCSNGRRHLSDWHFRRLLPIIGPIWYITCVDSKSDCTKGARNTQCPFNSTKYKASLSSMPNSFGVVSSGPFRFPRDFYFASHCGFFIACFDLFKNGIFLVRLSRESKMEMRFIIFFSVKL